MACAMLLGGAIWPIVVNGPTGNLITQSILATIGVVIVLAIVGWIAYAWINRSTVVKRLSDFEPIEEAA
jgi:hypothetical protein